MKSLLLLRHAKSSWNHPGLPDHDRPLSGRGKRDAPRMGRLLREQGILPNLIVSSTAKRARKTANEVARQSGYSGEILLDDQFYHANVGQWMATVKNLADSYNRVMLVGHNPGLEELLAELTNTWHPLPTAALAHVRLTIEQWAQLGDSNHGTLIDLWKPKELRGAT